MIQQVHATVNLAFSAACPELFGSAQDKLCRRASAHVLSPRGMKVLGLRDHRGYRDLYDLIIETLPPPDLLVSVDHKLLLLDL
jgi:hypothetical protein